MTGWLTGWKYRKSHEIIGSSARAVSDYQIKIKVHYGSGGDEGEDVYLNGKCRNDFGDVRFTDSDGITKLDYWIEEKVNGDYAVFWVKVPNIPQGVVKVESGSWTVDGRTYRYRTKITIKEKSGNNLTNYQVKIIINTKYLVDNGYATSSGNEIRFTDSDGQTLLSFWRENDFNQENTIYWVKIPSLPANTTKTIYIYYDANLTSVPDVSDGEATFDFFDNFGIFDSNKWKADTSKPAFWWTNIKTPSITVSNGLIYVGEHYTSQEGGIYNVNALPISDNYIAEARVKPQLGTDHAIRMWIYQDSSNSIGFNASKYTGYWRAIYKNAGSKGEVNVVVFSLGIWYKLRFIVSGTIRKGFIYDDEWNQIGTYEFPSISLSNPKLCFDNGAGSSVSGDNYGYIDWVRIRKYVEPEPEVQVEAQSVKIYIYYGKSDATSQSNQIKVKIAQLREHKRWTDYNPKITFGIVDGTKLRTDTDNSYGYGYVFFVVPASWINGKYIRWRWYIHSTISVTRTLAVAFIKDGVYNRKSDSDFPSGSGIPDKGNGTLQTLKTITITDSYGFATEDVQVNISPSEEYVTIFFRVNNAWGAYSIYMDIDWIEINTGAGGSGNLVRIEFTKSVVMERTGTYGDYGLYRNYISPEPSHGVWGSEESGIAHTVSITDVGRASDYIAKIPAKSLLDSGKSLDYFSKSASFHLSVSDIGRGLDYTSRSIIVNFSDTAGLLDFLAKIPAVSLLDSGRSVDSIAFGYEVTLLDRVFGDFDFITTRGKVLRDIVTGVDRIVKKPTVMLIDSAEVFDYIQSSAGFHLILTDAGKLSDYISKIASFHIVLADSSKLTDYISKISSINIRDSSSIYDVARKSMARLLRDSSSVGDYVSFGYFKALRDASRGLDYFSRTVSFHLDIVDIGEVEDYIKKNVSRTFRDTSTAIDILRKTISHIIRETITSLDVISKTSSKKLTDSLLSIDRISKNISKTVRDESVIYDLISKDVLRVILDQSRLLDYLKKTVEKSLFETSKVLDVAYREIARKLVDSITSIDYISKLTDKSLIDTVSTFDLTSKIMSKELMDRVYGEFDFRRTIGYTREIIDVSTVTDWHKKHVSREFKEITHVIDRLGRGTAIILQDVGLASDYVSKGILRSLYDASTVVDYVSKGITAILKDVALTSDYISRIVHLNVILQDVALTGDYISKSLSKMLMDRIYGDFDFKKISIYVRELADSSKVADWHVKETVKYMVETITSIDYLSKNIGKKIVDIIKSLDYISTIGAFHVTLYDAGKTVDKILKDYGKNLADTITASDYISKSIIHVILDTAKSIDSTSRSVGLTLRDRVFGDFYTSRLLGKEITDTVKAVDVKAVWDLAKILREYVTVRDSPYRTVIITLIDKVYHDLSTTKGIRYSLRDEVTALDRLLRIAFTICGYELRRVFMDDIILPDDHNLKVEACRCILEAIKRIRELLGE